jgi:hypothetical protein
MTYEDQGYAEQSMARETPESPLRNALAELDKALSALDMATHSLRERLTPLYVDRSEPSPDKMVNAVGSPRSEVVNLVEDAAARARAMEHRLSGLLAGLEL